MTVRRARAAGRLIVFEGPDGAGKSTLSNTIAQEFEQLGIPCRLVTFPGRDPGQLGRLVYEIHHDPGRFGVNSMTAAARQALHIAAHLDAIDGQILPALQRGINVLLERYWWSTWAYGVVEGAPRAVLKHLIRAELIQWRRIQPALVLLLQRESPPPDDYDLATWDVLRREYDFLANREKTRYPVVTADNNGAIGECVRRALAEILPRIGPTSQANIPSSPLGSIVERAFDGDSKRSQNSPNLSSGFRCLEPVRPSLVYDSYWRFAAERQRIFFKRLEGQGQPWTTDPVLAQHKFTNAYRASDRVSQYLIREVIYRDDLPKNVNDVVFRILLFKLFNKVETWALLEHELGPLVYAEYRFDRYQAALSRAIAQGDAIYSAAYIMPPGRGVLRDVAKHRSHLRLLELMMADELPKRLAGSDSMQQGFELLRAYPMIGNFLAYQLVTDINYSDITSWSEMEFVVAGPGAASGIRKCFLDRGGLSDVEVIRFVAEQQSDEFARQGVDFRSLWGRPLQLIDCQNLFCEIDKYARVAHPEFVGRLGRTRIKHRFSPKPEPIRYWYPPKWGINQYAEDSQMRPRMNASAAALGGVVHGSP